MTNTDETIYALISGKMQKMRNARNPDRNNFVIVCDYGDWSGFRTLAECEKQFAEIEKNALEQKKGNFYYRVVER